MKNICQEVLDTYNGVYIYIYIIIYNGVHKH